MPVSWGRSPTVAGIELVEHGTPMPWASSEGETEWSSPAAVTSKLARATAFDAFLLEYDDPRSGSFEPLAQAPDDKQVVLGLVSTKSARDETVAEITARIDDAARSFPLEQLGVSTQCGFASIADGNPITEQTEERKLQLVAEAASAAWG